MRKKIVTSPLLTDVNKQYAAVLEKVASLYDKKVTLLATNARTDDVDGELKQAGVNMSYLAATDVPKDLEAWKAQALPRLNQLLDASKK